MSDQISQISKIAEDLTKIEVNLIIKRVISAQKMPKPRHALIDIAKEFYTVIEEYGCLQIYENDPEEKRLMVATLLKHEEAGTIGSLEAFDALREVADFRIKEIRTELDRADLEGIQLSERRREDLLLQRPMLQRIKDKSDQIKGIFNALIYRTEDTPANRNEKTRVTIETEQEPLRLQPDEITLLRKIWEIGIEDIAMQTIIQLDGDVVTRIQPDFVNDLDVQRMHNEGVMTAISFWKDLIAVVKDFFVNLAGSVLGGRR